MARFPAIWLTVLSLAVVIPLAWTAAFGVNHGAAMFFAELWFSLLGLLFIVTLVALVRLGISKELRTVRNVVTTAFSVLVIVGVTASFFVAK